MNRPLEKPKPYLAKISEGKKIRDFLPTEQEEYNSQLITYLLSMLGISTSGEDGRESHYLVVDQFISEELGNFTYAEIKEAFVMLLKGEFNGMPELGKFEVYSKLDCIVLSKAMNCYSVIKRERLRSYQKPTLELPEITASEQLEIVKKGVIRCFDDFKESGQVSTSMFYVYEFLDENDIINATKEEKHSAMKIAKRQLKAENPNPIQRVVIGEGRIIAKAKVLILESFFRTLNRKKLLEKLSKITA